MGLEAMFKVAADALRFPGSTERRRSGMSIAVDVSSLTIISGVCGAKFVLIEWVVFGLGTAHSLPRQIVQPLTEALAAGVSAPSWWDVVYAVVSGCYFAPATPDTLRTAHTTALVT
jgi:hypothetical protein